VEEESAQLVLSTPRPTIDLTAARDALAKSIGDRAKVSTLHDMVVVDVRARGWWRSRRSSGMTHQRGATSIR
jgi:hypothetical protein